MKPSLRLLRVSRKLTLADVGGKVGVSDNTISRWERGVYPPSLEYARRYAGVLGVTLDDLIQLVNDAKNDAGGDAETASA